MNGSVLIDMAAALAVTALLAESYGIVRRRFLGAQVAPVVLGVLFGLMALLQMNNPIEPFDGLIVDLRNIPVALAGAFLGWRGLLPCLLIAAAARIGIGGVGVVAGIWGMALAGLASTIWARKMARYEKRSFGMLLLLALAMSAHLLGALALPRDLAIWFFTTAAGPILAMNLLVVPFIGALLERENRRLLHENRMSAASDRNPDSGLLTGSALVREATDAFAAQPFGSFAGLLVITPPRRWHFGLLGLSHQSIAPIQPLVLADHLTHWRLAGESRDGRILIPLTLDELATAHRLRPIVRDRLREGVGRDRTLSALDVSALAAPEPEEFLRLVETAALAGPGRWEALSTGASGSLLRPGEKSHVRRASLFNPAEHDALFAKADFLMARSRG